jgi:hypothetical protein
MVTVDSAMTNIAPEDSFDPAADKATDVAANVADRGQPGAVEREPRRSRQGKLREPLHALIVHFDADPSSRPPPAAGEDG